MTSLKKHLLALVAALGLAGGAPAMAADWTLEAGATSESTPALSVMLGRETALLSNWFESWRVHLGTGLVLLPGDEASDNAAWVVRPSLRYTAGSATPWFFEVGIGGALFANTRLETRSLSTAFQFEDRVALGVPVGPGALSLALTHYSNAGIKRPNDGFETLMLGYAYRF